MFWAHLVFIVDMRDVHSGCCNAPKLLRASQLQERSLPM
jgi:hypothetical protein